MAFGGFGGSKMQSSTSTAPTFSGFGGTSTTNPPTLGAGFGSTPAATSSTPAFGQTAGASAQPAGGSTSLFGGFGASSTNQPAPPAFSFGPSSTSQPATTNPPTFGASTSGLTTTQPSATQNPFSFGTGSTGANTGQASLFGAKAPNTAPSLSFGSFGQSTAQAPSTQTQNLFQSQSQPQPQASTFNPASSTLGQSSYLNSSVARNPIAPRGLTPQERLQRLVNKLTPDNSEYVFQSYVYDIAPPPPNGQVHQNYFNLPQTLYETAQRNNPDPERLIPVPIKGFEGLKQRVESQKLTADGLRTRVLAPMQEYIPKALSSITLDTQNKYDTCSSVHADQSLQLTQWISQISILSVRLRGQPLDPTEERIYETFRKVAEIYRDAGGGGKMEGRLAAMWAKIAEVKHVAALREVPKIAVGWSKELVDELTSVFATQNRELDALAKLMKDQKVDLDILERGLPSLLETA